jgi:hypothetical protein
VCQCHKPHLWSQSFALLLVQLCFRSEEPDTKVHILIMYFSWVTRHVCCWVETEENYVVEGQHCSWLLFTEINTTICSGKILEDWLVNLKFIGNWIHHMCGEILSCFFVNSQTGEGIIAVLSHLLKYKNEYDHTIWVWKFFVQMDCWQEDHYTFQIFLLSATCLSCSDSWY